MSSAAASAAEPMHVDRSDDEESDDGIREPDGYILEHCKVERKYAMMQLTHCSMHKGKEDIFQFERVWGRQIIVKHEKDFTCSIIPRLRSDAMSRVKTTSHTPNIVRYAAGYINSNIFSTTMQTDNIILCIHCVMVDKDVYKNIIFICSVLLNIQSGTDINNLLQKAKERLSTLCTTLVLVVQYNRNNYIIQNGNVTIIYKVDTAYHILTVSDEISTINDVHELFILFPNTTIADIGKISELHSEYDSLSVPTYIDFMVSKHINSLLMIIYY